jgi:hypothetical protein
MTAFVPTKIALKIRGVGRLSLLVFIILFSSHTLACDSKDKKSTNCAPEAIDKKKNKTVEWGDWGNSKYGVGVRGTLEKELNELDKSNLLRDASGVAPLAKIKKEQGQPKVRTKDIRKMMEQIKAMEKKLKRELDNDSEF